MIQAMTNEELVYKARHLPEVPHWEKETHWGKYRDAMRDHFLNNDPVDILCWSTVSATMFVGEYEVTLKEVEELKHSPRWEYYATTALMENNFGSPPRMGDLAYTSGNLVHQTHHLMQWEKATHLHIEDMSTIIEFGGGYGAMCAIARRMGFTGKYTLVDLPEFTLLQEYYLSNLGFEADCVSCDWSTDLRKCISRSSDIMIAIHSLSESPITIRDNFLAAVTPVTSIISYQNKFFNVDNASWIEMYKNTHKGYQHLDSVNEANTNINYLISWMKGRVNVQD
jgi:hypothetical protein